MRGPGAGAYWSDKGTAEGGVCMLQLNPKYIHFPQKVGYRRSIVLCRGQQRLGLLFLKLFTEYVHH